MSVAGLMAMRPSAYTCVATAVIALGCGGDGIVDLNMDFTHEPCIGETCGDRMRFTVAVPMSPEDIGRTAFVAKICMGDTCIEDVPLEWQCATQGEACEAHCSGIADVFDGTLKATARADDARYACGDETFESGGVCFELDVPTIGLPAGMIRVDLVVDDVPSGRRAVDHSAEVELVSERVMSCVEVLSCLNGYHATVAEAFDPGSVPPPQSSPGAMLSAGANQTCGVGNGGAVVCWGDVVGTVPVGTFSSVAVGDQHACGLGVDGTIRCWGNEAWATAVMSPIGSFVDVVAGTDFSCGIRSSTRVECWGGDHCIWAYDVGTGHEQVAASSDTMCVAGEGSARCIGAQETYIADAIRVAVGEAHVCAIKADGSIECTGDDAHGQLAAPSGSFIEIVAGTAHTCALGADLAVVCWGAGTAPTSGTCTTRPDCGQSAPPAERFVQISAGAYHVCGITEDSRALCWGDDEQGKATPPASFP